MAKGQGSKGYTVTAIGRRKTSVARIYMKNGSGKITVNDLGYEQYFDRDTLRMIVRQPLELVNKLGSVDLLINVSGGGKAGQAGAVRHGISRALNLYNPEDRPALKQAGLLTRDSREVERKKYGLHKARRRPQFSKR